MTELVNHIVEYRTKDGGITFRKTMRLPEDGAAEAAQAALDAFGEDITVISVDLGEA